MSQPPIPVNLRPVPALMSRLIAVHGKGAVKRFEQLAQDQHSIEVMGNLIYRLWKQHSNSGEKPFDLALATDIGAQMIGILRENQKT